LIWGYAPAFDSYAVERVLCSGCMDMGNQALYGYGRIDVYQSLLDATMSIAFPSGLPSGYVPPGLETRIDVEILPGGENYVPGSGMLHYRFDGAAFNTVPLTHLGGDLFEAVMPRTSPGDAPEFYFSAQGDGGTTIYSPPGAPSDVYAFDVAIIATLFYEDFENDLGWAVSSINLTDGEWERGDPAGDGTRGDPLEDADGSGKCFLTDNLAGNSDVDGGPTTVTSPSFDLSSGDARISYSYWFYNDDGDDPFDVEISNNGGASWTPVSTTVGGGGGWLQAGFYVGDFVSPTSQVKVRFSATDDPNDSVTEAGLDAVSIQRVYTDPGLWADAYSFSAAAGSGIDLSLDAGLSYSGRSYRVVGSFSGSQPGTVLPGGLVLPINRDFLTNFILSHPSSPIFQGFAGKLDGQGSAAAGLNIPAGTAAPYIGRTMTLAFTLTGAFDYVSNPMEVSVEP
jgi:hypothetical protein